MNETNDFIPIDKNSTRKVLGITWSIKIDEIIFDFSDLVAEAFERITTKRSILSISSKFFDPRGLLSPITIQLKLLFQLIYSDKIPWDQEISWDQEMPDSISDKWLKLVGQLWTLNKLAIPRQNIKVIKDEILSIELHGFCDSSLRAYGSLVYLRVLTFNGCFVSLLSGKSKVAPMKGFSIPRLELLGCVFLTELVNSVKVAIHPVWSVQNVYY